MGTTKLLAQITAVTILATGFSAVYLYASQQSQNWTVIHKGTSLSPWYLVDSCIDSILGFSVNVIWPYALSGWISNKFAVVLLGYIFGVDESFRLVWYVCHKWFHVHLSHKSTYLACWAASNDMNTYFVVPLFVLMYRWVYMNHNKSPLIIQLTNYGTFEPETAHRLRTVIALYVIAAAAVLAVDVNEYFLQDATYLPLYKLPFFIALSVSFLWEKYKCRNHANQPFVHLVFVCTMSMSQNMLFDWGILVAEIKRIVVNMNQHVATAIVFTCYSVYFKILAVVAKLMSTHVNCKQQTTAAAVFPLHFIYIVFFDVYLTLFLCASPTIDWTVVYMIVSKLVTKYAMFNKAFQSYLPSTLQSGHETRTVHYVYAMLASCVAYVGQLALLTIDFFIDTGDTGWILSPVNATKTAHNLLVSMVILLIALCSELLAFYLVFRASKRAANARLSAHMADDNIVIDESSSVNLSPSPAAPASNISMTDNEAHVSGSASALLPSDAEFSIYKNTSSVRIHMVYFIFAAAYSQMLALNLTQFFPFLF